MSEFSEIERVVAADQRTQIFAATVVANSGNEVQIQTDDGNTFTNTFPKLFGVSVVAADRVLVVRVSTGSYVVLGKIIHN